MRLFQKCLFAPQIRPISEAEVNEILVDVFPYLWGAVVNSVDDLFARRAVDHSFRILEEGEAAQWLRPQIIERARRLFEDNDAFRFRVVRQQKFFEYKEQISICFKKVTRRRTLTSDRFERSNYMTDQNRQYWNQNIVEAFSNYPRIIIGYELIKEMTDARVMVGYPRTIGRGFKWLFEMENQDAMLAQIAEDTANKDANNESDRNAEKSFLIKPRTQKPGVIREAN